MHLFQAITQWVMNLIAHLGYAGLFAGMAAQATGFIPLPSEIMMSYGGYLADAGSLKLWLVIAAGAGGDTMGALLSYAIGYFGGRPILERYGKYVFIRKRELDRAHEWFLRFGTRAVFICKLLPGVRAFAALPAGVARMPLGLFVAYTAAGAIIWSTAFAALGVTLGRNWSSIAPVLHRFSLLFIALLLAGIAFWLWSHFRAEKQTAKA